MIRRVLSAVLAFGLGASAVHAQTVVAEYYHLDAIGSVRAVTDQAGATIRRHDYFPFGEEYLAQPGTDPLRFSAKERDSETRLDYFGARSYRARTGTFSAVDPILDVDGSLADPQRWNRYAYSLNNPLRYVDPDGENPRQLLTYLMQSQPIQALIRHPGTQRVLSSPVVSRSTAVLRDLQRTLFDLSVRLFGPPDAIAKSGDKLAQQIARWREATGATGGRTEFLQFANDLIAGARESGTFVTTKIGSEIVSIYRLGNSFVVQARNGQILSYVAEADEAIGGILTVYQAAGGK